MKKRLSLLLTLSLLFGSISPAQIVAAAELPNMAIVEEAEFVGTEELAEDSSADEVTEVIASDGKVMEDADSEKEISEEVEVPAEEEDIPADEEIPEEVMEEEPSEEIEEGIEVSDEYSEEEAAATEEDSIEKIEEDVELLGEEEEAVLYVKDMYYRIGERTPFYAEVGGITIDENGEYFMEVSCEGQSLGTFWGDHSWGERLHFDVEDLELAADTAALDLRFYEENTGTNILETSIEVSFADAPEVEIVRPAKVAPNPFSVILKVSLTQEEADQLLSHRTRAYFKYGDNSYPINYANLQPVGDLLQYYGGTFESIPWLLQPEEYELQINTYSQTAYPFQAGDMVDIEMLVIDEEELYSVIIEDAIKVSDGAVVQGVYSITNTWYSNLGPEILYMSVQGQNAVNAEYTLKLLTMDGMPASDEEPMVIYAGNRRDFKFRLNEAAVGQNQYRYEIVGEIDGTKKGSFIASRNDFAGALFINGATKSMWIPTTEAAEGKKFFLTIERSGSSEIVAEDIPAEAENGSLIYDLSAYGLTYTAIPFRFTLKDEDGTVLRSGNPVSPKIYFSNLDFVTVDGAFYSTLKNITATDPDAGVIDVMIRSIRDGSIVKQLTKNSGEAFTNAELEDLEAGEPYLIEASQDGISLAVGIYSFDIKTQTKEIRIAVSNMDDEEIAADENGNYQIPIGTAKAGLRLDAVCVGNSEATAELKISDPKVAALSDGVLKALAEGSVKVTATASDNAAVTQTVEFYFVDITPRIEQTTLAMNVAVESEVRTGIYPVDGYEIVDVTTDSAAFDVMLEEDELVFTVKNFFMAAATVRVPLNVVIQGPDGNQDNISAEIAIKVTKVVPKVTAAQVGKVNLFYTDAEAVIKLTANAELAGVVADTDNTSYEWVDSSEDKTIQIFKVKEGCTPAKTETIKIRLRIGNSILELFPKITAETKAPSLALTPSKGSTYRIHIYDNYYNVYNPTVTFQVLDSKTKQVLDVAEESVTLDPSCAANFEDLRKDGRSFAMDFVGTSSATALIRVQEENWSKPVTLKYVLSVATKIPTVKLSATSVTLNKNYLKDPYTSTEDYSWGGETHIYTSRYIYGADSKLLNFKASVPYTTYRASKGAITGPVGNTWEWADLFDVSAPIVGFGLDNTPIYDYSKVAVSLKDVTATKYNDEPWYTPEWAHRLEELPNGKYKVPVYFSFINDNGENCWTDKPVAITVNVTDALPTATWKVSGTINPVDRMNTSVIATPTLKNINGTIVGVDFCKADKLLGLDQKFTLSLEDGKVKIRLKDGVSLTSKDTKYTITPVIKIMTDIGYVIEEEFQTPGFSVAVKQKLPKLSVTTKNLTVYAASTTGRTKYFGVKVATVPEAQVIKNENFSMDPNFDIRMGDNGRFIVTLKNRALAAKTYTVKTAIRLEGQTTDTNPVSMSVKVIVKK